MGIILRLRNRKVLGEQEDFVTELEHQRGLGKRVADQMQRMFEGSAIVADFPNFPTKRVRDLATKRGVEVPF